MNWLWIDPGETVGWARGTVHTDGNLEDQGFEVQDYGQNKSKTFLLTLLENATNYDIVGYETYNITSAKLQAHLGSNVPTLQVIGGIRLAVWAAQARSGLGFPRIETQRPSQKRTGMAAAQVHVPELVPVLKAALAGEHDDGHYGDAILHAIAWYHTNYGPGR